MATLSPSTPHPQRPPPPSLFQNPPSRNASSVSLVPPPPSTTTNKDATRAALLRSRSTRGPDPSSATPLRSGRPQLSTTPTEGDRTEALWAEMQATLADVEVSAFNSTHMFGAAHAKALEDLRVAQIGLAQAWGRGAAADGDKGEGSGDGGKGKGKGEGGAEKEEARDEDGDEEGVLGASRRREANERFFGKVREGVKDVVGRLDAVADAMAKVEMESRDIWTASETGTSGSASATS